jgi:hypothetical protein
MTARLRNDRHMLVARSHPKCLVGGSVRGETVGMPFLPAPSVPVRAPWGTTTEFTDI